MDTLTFLAPLALYVKMGTFNIISTGLLTLFFKGLLELSKSFLDPFGREGYRAHNIRVDVLVSEMNFGASSRWINAGDALPSELLERDEPELPPQAGPPLVGNNVQGGSNQSVQAGASPVSVTSQDSFAEGMAQGYDLLSKQNNTPNEMHDSGSDIIDSPGGQDPNGKSSGFINGSEMNELQ